MRYHPSGFSPLPSLNWSNFVEYDGISSFIQPLLEKAIKRIISSKENPKIGMGLSGGADSTTILALTRKCFPDLEVKTYCVSFGDDDKEVEDARYISELYSTDHKHVHIENPFKDLKKLIELVDEPRWNLYPYYLFYESSKECDLILTGDGGDELFGGYVFRYKYVTERSSSNNLVRTYLEAHNRDWVPDQEEIFAIPFLWNDIYKLFTNYFDNPLPLMSKILLADYNGKLRYDFARTSHAFSKHFDLEIVAPMLEPEVLYVASHLPNSLRYDPANNLGKIILRQILLENSGYNPAIKGKIGWGMDTSAMWDKYVKDICLDSFKESKSVELGIINKDWLKTGFKKADEHKPRYISKMFGLLALELWLRIKYA